MIRAVAAGEHLEYCAAAAVRHDPRDKRAELARKSFRLGFAAAQHLYHSDEPLGGRDILWLHPRSYLPRREIGGLERLIRDGYRPSWRERLAMRIVQYTHMRLPMLAGNFVGVVKERRLPQGLERATPT